MDRTTRKTAGASAADAADRVWYRLAINNPQSSPVMTGGTPRNFD
jgi:hypothetical protein